MAVYLVPVKRGRRVVIDKAVIFFGRHPDCDVILNTSRKISRKHCCIAQVNETFFVRDLGSMNGVHVNGQRVRRQAQIRIGDEILIGDVPFRFETDRTIQQREEAAKRGGPDIPPVAGLPRRRVAPPPLTTQRSDISLEYPVPIPDPGPDDEQDDVIPIADEDSFVQGNRISDDVIMLDSHDDLPS